MPISEFILCLAVMAVTTYLVRLLPLLLINKEIKNRFILSFLYYIPYAVLSAMTFPTVFYCTGNLYSSITAVVVCVFLSFINMSMIYVALGGAVSVAISECIVNYILQIL